MCKPAPGARCLSHVRAQLDKTIERQLDVEGEMATLRHTPGDHDARMAALSQKHFAHNGKAAGNGECGGGGAAVPAGETSCGWCEEFDAARRAPLSGEDDLLAG